MITATYFTTLGHIALVTAVLVGIVVVVADAAGFFRARWKDAVAGWKARRPKRQVPDDLEGRDPVTGVKWAPDDDPWRSEAPPYAPNRQIYPGAGKAPSGEAMEDAPAGIVATKVAQQRRLAALIARQEARKELAAALVSVRCPVCKSPEGTTCNPELPEDMPVIQLESYVFAHGLRIAKAVGMHAADREAVLGLLPDDDTGDAIRDSLVLAEGTAGAAQP